MTAENPCRDIDQALASEISRRAELEKELQKALRRRAELTASLVGAMSTLSDLDPITKELAQVIETQEEINDKISCSIEQIALLTVLSEKCHEKNDPK